MIGELITAVSKALGITEALVNENLSQKYDSDEKKRVEEYQNILVLNDPEDKRNQLGGFVMRLCINAGTPIGRLSGTSIEVPVECFDALIRTAIENEKQDKMLSSLIQSLKSK